jgi:fatty acid-binding protein DegV
MIDSKQCDHPSLPLQCHPADCLQSYIEKLQKKAAILSIHISSGLSGTINAARGRGAGYIGGQYPLGYAQPFRRPEIPGNCCSARSRSGWALDAIQERLGKIRERAEVIYTLDTLEYLARGGRIGRVKAMAGALLKLKPVIRVDSDGKYSTVSTGRTLGKSISAIAEHLHAKYANAPVYVTILHGRFAEKAEMLANELKGNLNIARLETLRISPVLGVHTGPGVIGAAVVPADLLEDLA